MDKTDILQDISVDFSQLVKKHIKNIKKLDSATQKEFGRAFGDMKDLLDDLSEQAMNESINEDLSDVLKGVGSVLKGAGQGVASILNVLIGGVVAMGCLIMVGAAGAIGGITTLLGFAGAGMVSLVKKFVYIPAIEATLKRLSEDKEVMAIAKKPTAKGLRTIAEKKLTKAERVLVGKWIKSNITRRQLGIGRGGRKLKSGPGLDKFDKSFMTDF